MTIVRGTVGLSPEHLAFVRTILLGKATGAAVYFVHTSAREGALAIEQAVAYALAGDGQTTTVDGARRLAGRSFGGLTRREVEVLRLVAQAHSNREIAAALVLSEKTVERHLSHIFAKLQVSSRSGATRVAVQAGIA